MKNYLVRGPNKGYPVTKRNVKLSRKRQKKGWRPTRLHKLAAEVIFHTTGFRTYEKALVFKVASDKRLIRSLKRRSSSLRQAKKRLDYLRSMKKQTLKPIKSEAPAAPQA